MNDTCGLFNHAGEAVLRVDGRGGQPAGRVLPERRHALLDLGDGEREVLKAESQKVGAANMAICGGEDGREDGNAGIGPIGRTEAKGCECVDKARLCFIV